MSDSDGPPPLVDSSSGSDDPDTMAAIHAIGRAAVEQAAVIRATAPALPGALARVFASRPWAAEEGRRLHRALTQGHPPHNADCPAARATELLSDLRATVEGIQRRGNPGPRFTWSHVVNPILWLSLPAQRDALVRMWLALGLPLHPLEVLETGLRERGLNTPLRPARLA